MYELIERERECVCIIKIFEEYILGWGKSGCRGLMFEFGESVRISKEINVVGLECRGGRGVGDEVEEIGRSCIR